MSCVFLVLFISCPVYFLPCLFLVLSVYCPVYFLSRCVYQLSATVYFLSVYKLSCLFLVYVCLLIVCYSRLRLYHNIRCRINVTLYRCEFGACVEHSNQHRANQTLYWVCIESSKVTSTVLSGYTCAKPHLLATICYLKIKLFRGVWVDFFCEIFWHIGQMMYFGVKAWGFQGFFIPVWFGVRRVQKFEFPLIWKHWSFLWVEVQCSLFAGFISDVSTQFYNIFSIVLVLMGDISKRIYRVGRITLRFFKPSI